MTVKRILADLLLACMLAALFGGCASDKAENTAPASSSAENGEVDGNLTYLSEKLTLPDNFENVYFIASSGDRLYLNKNGKLYSMNRDALVIQEVSAYAPLEGYAMGTLGTVYGGGLLIVEQSRESCVISCVDEDGSVDSVTDITEVASRYDNFLPKRLFSDEGGNIYFLMSDDVLIISADGKSSYHAGPESGKKPTGIALSGSGTAYITVHEGMNSDAVYELNPNGTFGKILCEIPLNSQLLSGGKSYDLLYSDGEGLYTLDTESGNTALLLNWMDCDIDPAYVNEVWDVNDRIILCYDMLHEMFLLKEGTEPDRIALRLATYQHSPLLDQIINDYNSKNDQYRIVVDDYSKYDESTPDAGLMKLNTEIQAGNIPDIIDFAHIPASAYEEKGLLVDLYPFIDADPDLDRSDLLELYIKTFERDGALYQALMGFSLSCFVGKSDIVGTGHGWTLDEMIAIQAQYAPDSFSMGGMPRDEAIIRYLDSIYGEFIDWKTGECSFSSDEFIRLLEYFATLDEDMDAENRKTKNVLSGDLIIYPTIVPSVIGIQIFDIIFGEEKYTFKGYPTDDGNGIALNYVDMPALGITAACSDKEGAWSFVRMLFSEAIGKLNNITVIPVNKNILDMVNADMMTDRTVTNDEGEEVVVQKWITLFDDEYIELYAATQNQVDRFLELLNSCDLVWRKDDSIATIVKEELGPFFAGNKTSRETADMIQSRVQIYVAEQKS